MFGGLLMRVGDIKKSIKGHVDHKIYIPKPNISIS